MTRVHIINQRINARTGMSGTATTPEGAAVRNTMVWIFVGGIALLVVAPLVLAYYVLKNG